MLKRLCPNKYFIQFIITFYNYRTKLKAGEYLIPQHYSVKNVLDLIANGQTALHPLTIAEGLTSYQIEQIINQNTLLVGSKVSNIPEGSLLPETYLIPRGMTRDKFVLKMQQAMTLYLSKVLPDNQSVLSPEQVIILASIVEKETALASERATVASVFLNRLKLNMPLQSDPTVVYALSQLNGQPFLNTLSRKNLLIKHLSNTYINSGLPPQPICHPGKASINAVLHPALTSYLYFVADGSGGHIFATSYKQHTINHQKWRMIRATLQGNKN